MRITHAQRTAFIRHLSVQIIRRVVPLSFESAASRFEGHHRTELILRANTMRALPANVDPAAARRAAAVAAAYAAYAAHGASVAAAVAVADAAADAARRAAAVAAAYAAYAAHGASVAAAVVRRADAQRVREEYAACLLEAADACLPTGAIPIDPAIDSRVYRFVTAECEGLDMGDWHGDYRPENWCGTTHCRAGAAVACSGDEGFELEQAFGPAVAGALIYAASYRDAGKPVTIPDFYNMDSAGVLEEMKQLAALEGGEA